MAGLQARPARATFTVLLAASLVLLAIVAFPLWKPLFMAVVLAGAMRGAEERLARRLHGRRRLAAGLLLLGLLVLVLAPLAVFVTYLVGQAIELGQAAYELFQKQGVEGFIALAPDRFEPFLRSQMARLPQSFGTWVSRLSAQGMQAANALGSAVSGTGSLLFSLAMLLVALYFLLADGPALMRWLRQSSPLGSRITTDLAGELRRTATSVLSSTVATAAVQSVVATIGYLIARVPAPLVFGFLTFLAAFIPSVGTSVVALPIAAVLLLTGHFVAGGFLAIWAVLVTGTVDNVLKPWLARGGAGLHGAIIFFAMIGGILSFGALGLILGPMIVSLLVALVRLGRQHAFERTEIEVSPPPAPPPSEAEPLRPH